jgi:hypothetical protein
MDKVVQIREVLTENALVGVQSERHTQGMLGLGTNPAVDSRQIAIDRITGHDSRDKKIDGDRGECGQQIEEDLARESFHISFPQSRGRVFGTLSLSDTRNERLKRRFTVLPSTRCDPPMISALLPSSECSSHRLRMRDTAAQLN